MKISNTLKGYILAFTSVLAVSNVYIFSKAALKEVHLLQFGVYWFGFGLIWILLYAKYRKCFHLIKDIPLKKHFLMAMMGVFEVLGTYFFFKAIQTISDPSVTSFLGNISPVIIISLSFIILKERFSRLEFFGMLLALFGALVISTKGNFNTNIFIDGIQYILFSSIIFATNGILIKKNIKDLPPIILTINRSLFLFISSLIALFISHKSFQISDTALSNIFIGSLLGPFLTVVTGFLALKYIPLSRKAIIGSTKGIFVMLGSFLYFGKFPEPITILGGFITILGVLLISYGKIKKAS